jgi:hypothetical protein
MPRSRGRGELHSRGGDVGCHETGDDCPLVSLLLGRFKRFIAGTRTTGAASLVAVDEPQGVELQGAALHLR